MIDTSIPINRQLDPTLGIATRLRELVRRHGFIKFTRLTGISKAQLSRYLNGTSIPSDRLAIIAETCDVSANWLLQGKLEVLHQPHQHARLELITQTLFDVLTTEYRGNAWKPSELRHLLPLLLLNDRFLALQNTTWACTPDEIHRSLITLETFRTNGNLKFYQETIELFMKHDDLEYDPGWAIPLCNLLHQSCIGYYNHPLLQGNYFDRVNIHMRKPNHDILQNFIKTYQRFKGNFTKCSLLDIACGTGRYISHIYRNHEGVEVHGIDTSNYALKLCEEYSAANLLPRNSVLLGDALAIPHEANSFDAVLSSMLIHYIPLIRNNTLHGVGKALSEIHRVLKPGGICQITMRHNTPDEFLPNFCVCHPVPALTQLAENLNMRVIGSVPLNIDYTSFPGNTVPDRYFNFLMLTIQKQ